MIYHDCCYISRAVSSLLTLAATGVFAISTKKLLHQQNRELSSHSCSYRSLCNIYKKAFCVERVPYMGIHKVYNRSIFM